MAFIYLGARGGFEAVEQIVCLHAQTFAPADFDVRFFRVFLAERIAEFGGATRRERHDFIRKMNRALRLFLEPERAKPRYNDVLKVRLPGVDDVVHDGGMS